MELSCEPPCCKIACFRYLCESNYLCKFSGKIGLKIFEDYRAPIMLVTAFLAALSTTLILVAVVAMSYDNETVKNTCWTYGETDQGNKIWVGLNEFVTEINGVEKSTGWRSTDCEDGYCNDCKTVCLESISFAAMNLITSIPNIKGAIERSTVNGDRNCEKNFQLITGAVGFFTSLASLTVYADGCARNLPDELISGHSIDYEFGPGFICLLIATLLLPFNFFANLLLPVPDKNETLKTSLVANDTERTASTASDSKL
jgi:hypothetical protein